MLYACIFTYMRKYMCACIFILGRSSYSLHQIFSQLWFTKKVKDPWDSLAGKGTCCPAWWPELDPWNLVRKRTCSRACPLTSTLASWHLCTPAYTHWHMHKINKEIIIQISLESSLQKVKKCWLLFYLLHIFRFSSSFHISLSIKSTQCI